MRSKIKYRSHFTKMVQENYSTLSQSIRFLAESRRCPHCSSPKEDRDHILCCPHPKRREWRKEFQNKTSKFCEDKRTYPPIRVLLCQALTQWFNDPTQIFKSTQNFIHQNYGLSFNNNTKSDGVKSLTAASPTHWPHFKHSTIAENATHFRLI